MKKFVTALFLSASLISVSIYAQQDASSSNTQAKRPRRTVVPVSPGVINDKAKEKVAPEYPKDAKAQKIEGTVEVEVLIDEGGKVIEAEAVKGHQLLREAATTAAKQWKFKVIELSGNPVAFSGRITFKFNLYCAQIDTK